MIISKISRDLGLSRSLVRKIIQSATHRYKVYSIKKRNGGTRKIFHPARELKILQLWIAENIFSHFPVHSCVYSYKVGVSIFDHVKCHRKNNYLMRVDFKEFFPSIKSKDVVKLIDQNKNRIPFTISEADQHLVARIACRYETTAPDDSNLTIGAPSSPPISNAILYDFDKYWHSRCNELSVTYTRFADDLFFSTNEPNLLEKIYSDLKIYLRKYNHPRLLINEDKTVFTSRKRKRVITGLVLTSENKVSIGREKKRLIKSLIHSYKLTLLDQKQTSYLRGYLAYVKSVDPNFLLSLEAKYGKDIINEIRNIIPCRLK